MTWDIRPALVAALDMIRGRSGRAIAALLQFTVGFAALGILSAVVLQSQFTARLLLTTFNPPDVLGLYPAARSDGGLGFPASAAEPLITAANLADLESVPGVREVAVLWRGEALLPDGDRIEICAVNEAFEDLAGLSLLDRPTDAPPKVAGSGPGWVFPTEGALESLGRKEEADGPRPRVVRYSVLGQAIESRVGGTVSPRAGWPPPPQPGGLKDFTLEPMALVVDLPSVGERAWLDNAVWLVLDPGADPAIVESALEAWPAAHGRPELVLKGVSVREEIARQVAGRNPVTWVAGLLAVLLLVMSALGLTGQTMLAADTRRSEWALRLALGATRAQVLLQAVLETSLGVIASAILGLVIAVAVSPMVTEGSLRVVDWIGPGLLGTLLGALLVSALATIYPVRKVSREDATWVLKEFW